MCKYLERLRNFLGANFHQDIEDIYKALDEFLARVTTKDLKETLKVIDEFLIDSNMTKEEKEEIINYETEVYFPAYYINPLDWMRYIRDRIEEKLEK